MTVHECINSRNYALVTEVEQECIFLLLEVGKLSLELLVKRGVAGHHTASHRIGKAPFCCSFCIYLSDLRMIGETQIVVETPAEYLLAVEYHVGTELTFKLRIHVISECLLSVLSKRAA